MSMPLEVETRAFLERLDRQLGEAREKLAAAKAAKDETGREFWRDWAGALSLVEEETAPLRALLAKH